MNIIPKECLDEYMICIQNIKNCGFADKACDLYEQEEGLIHPDCHCFSVFVKNGRAAVGIRCFRSFSAFTTCFNRFGF